MLYRGTLASIHFKFWLRTPQSSWKTFTRRRNVRNVSGRVRRTNCKQNKVSVFGAATGVESSDVVEIAGYREKARSERNIKYCPRSLSVLANPTITTTPADPFILLVDTNCRSNILSCRSRSPLERSFINFVRFKDVDKTTSQNRCFDFSCNCSRRLSHRIYFPFKSRFFKRKIILILIARVI